MCHILNFYTKVYLTAALEIMSYLSTTRPDLFQALTKADNGLTLTLFFFFFTNNTVNNTFIRWWYMLPFCGYASLVGNEASS